MCHERDEVPALIAPPPRIEALTQNTNFKAVNGVSTAVHQLPDKARSALAVSRRERDGHCMRQRARTEPAKSRDESHKLEPTGVKTRRSVSGAERICAAHRGK